MLMKDAVVQCTLYLNVIRVLCCQHFFSCMALGLMLTDFRRGPCSEIRDGRERPVLCSIGMWCFEWRAVRKALGGAPVARFETEG